MVMRSTSRSGIKKEKGHFLVMFAYFSFAMLCLAVVPQILIKGDKGASVNKVNPIPAIPHPHPHLATTSSRLSFSHLNILDNVLLYMYKYKSPISTVLPR